MDPSQFTVERVPDQTGRTVVVTGANSGIGLAATEALAAAGVTVVMACRSVDRGERAAGEVRADTPDADLDVRECDLGDLDSVESFAAGVRADYCAVDALCNNAGVMAIPRSETADGFETQFGVNHLGHFALTGHLLPALGAADGEARVVTQSSGLHERGRMEFEDLHGRRAYDKWDAYAQSKLANLLFAYELDRRCADAGLDVTSVGVHPGYAATNLQLRGPEAAGSTVRKLAMKVANALVAQSPEQGALPLLYAATAGGVAGGEYYGPGGLMDMRGAPERQRSSERSYDRQAAQRLWDVSASETGVSYDFAAAAGAESPAGAEAQGDADADSAGAAADGGSGAEAGAED